MDAKIPSQILERVKDDGTDAIFLGEKDGISYYALKFPEGTITGFPIVYAYDKKLEEVKQLGIEDSFNVLLEFE